MKNMVKKSKPRFRVGDWVTLPYGTRVVLAQVVEDRGHLGFRGRRLYGLRLDWSEGEPTYLEVAEERLEPASETDREWWRKHWMVGIHQTMTYRGSEEDENGTAKPLFHYLIVAKPGPTPGSGVATIYPSSRDKAPALANGAANPIAVSEGGPEAALEKAREFLDARHPDLKRIVGAKRP